MTVDVREIVDFLRGQAKREDLTPSERQALKRASRLVRRPVGEAHTVRVAARPQRATPAPVKAPSEFPAGVRSLVAARSGGVCELCGKKPADSIHHRRGRGMGGDRRPDTNRAANALHLCGDGTVGCHGWAESHPAEARALGVKLRRHETPVEVPVQLAGGLVWLDDDGNIHTTDPTG